MLARIKEAGLVPVAVFAVSVAVAVAAALLIHGVVRDQERRLLRERGGEVALTLQQSVSNVESALPLFARLARLDGTPAQDEFEQAARPLLVGGVLTLGAVEKRGSALRVHAAVGSGPQAGETLSGPRAELVRRAFASQELATSLFSDARGTRIGLARRGRLFVAYQESAVDPTRPLPATPGSPYEELTIALYASPGADPSKLALTSTGKPLRGDMIDRRVIPVGADRWLLLTSSRRPLVGRFATDLPWMILAAGLLTALLTTALVTVLVNRRRYALAAVDARTAELRRALDEKTVLEEREREARSLAESANQSKNEFLSRMSHELRTPLNAILGFAQLLELSERDPRDRESVAHILRGGRHLLDLINEILDISRIEAGKLAMSPEAVMVGDALADVLSLVRPLAEDADVRLITELDGLGDRHVQADRQRLKQILLNLLSNGIKYNRRGGTTTVVLEDPGADRLRILVRDEGQGIAAEQLPRLFMPFDRLGAERGAVEGTGLGLALSKRLAELMGGDITIVSNVGAGTTFALELAVAPKPAARRPSSGELETLTEAAGLRTATILCIEDNVSNVTLVERIFDHAHNVRVIPAMQGGLGLELARQHQPDLILLDLHLPDMSGEDVLKELVRDPATRELPVVILSADATPGQLARMRDLGAEDYLTKPLDVGKFIETVRRFLEDGRPVAEDLTA